LTTCWCWTRRLTTPASTNKASASSCATSCCRCFRALASIVTLHWAWACAQVRELAVCCVLAVRAHDWGRCLPRMNRSEGSTAQGVALIAAEVSLALMAAEAWLVLITTVLLVLITAWFGVPLQGCSLRCPSASDLQARRTCTRASSATTPERP
jgi:hypothetical protein